MAESVAASAGIAIRVATPDDAGAVAALLAGGTLFPEHEDATAVEDYADAVAEIVATPGLTMLVAEVDGAVVGMCEVITFRHVQHRGGRCAELESLHVAAPHRSHGVGAVLLAAAIRHARELGCYRLQLTTNQRRTDAQRFYVRHGFTPSHVGMKLDL
jgi:GNAT superfamily N-acetyltransferase